MRNRAPPPSIPASTRNAKVLTYYNPYIPFNDFGEGHALCCTPKKRQKWLAVSLGGPGYLYIRVALRGRCLGIHKLNGGALS